MYNRRDDLNNVFPDNGFKLKYWQNGILTLGAALDTNFNYYKQGTILTFADTLGNLLWSKKYYLPGYVVFQINQIVSFNNSSFCAVGFAYKDTINNYDLFFAKFNSVGDTLFTKVFKDTCSLASVDAIRFNNSEFVVLNSWAADFMNAEYSKINLMKMDSMGNIVNQSFDNLALRRPQQLLLDTLRQKFYVFGTYKTQPGNNYNVRAYFNTYNYSFSYLSTNAMLGNTVNEYFQSANFLNGSIYYALQITVPNPPNPNNATRVKLEKFTPPFGAATINSITLGPLDPLGYSSIPNIEFVNGNMLTVPFSDPTNGNRIYFIDTTLTWQCSTALTSTTSAPLDDSPWGILVPQNVKRVYGTGRINNTSTVTSVDHWNFCTENVNIFLKNKCGVGVQENELNAGIKIFPNPTSDRIFVDLEQFNSGTFIKIRNCLGQIVENVEVVSERSEINLAECKSGIYFLEVVERGELIVSRKVVKQ